jgi:hypothetical protein
VAGRTGLAAGRAPPGRAALVARAGPKRSGLAEPRAEGTAFIALSGVSAVFSAISWLLCSTVLCPDWA